MYTKQLVHDKMLGSYDVDISIMWKHFLRVARLTGVAMADRVRQDYKELTNINRLSCAKQKVGSVGLKELCAARGRSMEKENGVVPRRVERAEGPAVQPQSLRLTARKAELRYFHLVRLRTLLPVSHRTASLSVV
jgi:hypothetical protein